MRAIGTGLIMVGVATALPGIASAASIDFNDAEGSYTALALADGATLGAGGSAFYVTDSWLDAGVNGLALSSHDPDGIGDPNLSPYRIDFANAMGSVSVAFADECFLNCDTDTGYLQAFDAGGNLLDWAEFALSEESLEGYGLLSVTGNAISYVLFWSTSDVDDGANSVYWDNISYEISEVPLPGTLGLLGLGLAGLGLLRRKAP